jgi:hypothetical protein
MHAAACGSKLISAWSSSPDCRTTGASLLAGDAVAEAYAMVFSFAQGLGAFIDSGPDVPVPGHIREAHYCERLVNIAEACKLVWRFAVPY